MVDKYKWDYEHIFQIKNSIIRRKRTLKVNLIFEKGLFYEL